MIRKWLTYLTVSLLSVLFSYAACGYNLAKYCCSVCETEGIEALIDEPCHNSEASTCCTNHHEEDNAGVSARNCAENTCELIHLKVDDTVFSSEGQRLSHTHTINVILYTNLVFVDNANAEIAGNALNPPDNPTHLSGRAVLNSNCILRI